MPANLPFPPVLPDDSPREVGGSGVVIDADKGFVLTNDHVVQGAPRVVVILHDGRERTASQIRRDPKSDLALLVLDGRAPRRPNGATPTRWTPATGSWRSASRSVCPTP